MKRPLLVIVSIFGFLSSGAASAEEVLKYFAKMPGVISPLLEFTPTGELTAKQANKNNHYVARYDDTGRMSSLKYFKRTEPSSDSYFYAHEVRYTYEEGKRIRAYFDVDGQPKAMSRHYYRSDNVQKEEYILDGNKTTLHMYGIGGKRVEAGTGTYVFEGEFLEGRGLVQRLYRKDGTPGIIFNYLPFEVSLLTQDEHGFIHQILNFDETTGTVKMHDAAGFSEMRIMFDKYGNELGWDFRNVDGALVNRAKDIVDGGHARWIYDFEWIDRTLGQYKSYVERYYTADGAIFCKADIVCATKREFNERTNATRVEIWNESDGLVWDPDQQFAKLEFDYDKEGRRIETRLYGADAKLRTSGFARRIYNYADDGTQSVMSFDHLGNELDAK